jgi:hypothetical protein
MAEKKAKRVVLTLGYMKYVLPAEAGTALFLALTDCEEYTANWDSTAQASIPEVFPVKADAISLSVLTEEQYAIGKLTYAAKQTKQGETK